MVAALRQNIRVAFPDVILLIVTENDPRTLVNILKNIAIAFFARDSILLITVCNSGDFNIERKFGRIKIEGIYIFVVQAITLFVCDIL